MADSNDRPPIPRPAPVNPQQAQPQTPPPVPPTTNAAPAVARAVGVRVILGSENPPEKPILLEQAPPPVDRARSNIGFGGVPKGYQGRPQQPPPKKRG